MAQWLSATTQSQKTPKARAFSRGVPRCWLDTTPHERPTGTTHDQPNQRVPPRQRGLKWMSVFHNVARGAQDRARPHGWQSFQGRLPLPPENDKIAFRGGWYKSETPQPLRRPTQTRQAPPARASSTGARQCWVDTTPREGVFERYATACRSVQSLP